MYERLYSIILATPLTCPSSLRRRLTMREPSAADTLLASVCHNTLRGILQYSMGVYMTRAKGVARPMSDLLVSRRRLLRAGALGAGALALPAWARGADLHGGFIDRKSTRLNSSH